MSTDWERVIHDLLREFPDLRSFPPAPREAVTQAEQVLGVLPEELKALYSTSNGLQYEWFTILPVEDPADLKRTWDSLTRANDPTRSKYAEWGDVLFTDYLVFAAMSGMTFAALEKSSSALFFSDDEGLYGTDFSLSEFIHTAAREVRDL